MCDASVRAKVLCQSAIQAWLFVALEYCAMITKTRGGEKKAYETNPFVKVTCSFGVMIFKMVFKTAKWVKFYVVTMFSIFRETTFFH